MEKMNCIVLDDESMGRKLVEENVRQIPFLNLVGSCKNAFEAMEVLAKEPVDLIFSDIQMPGMLGTQFIQSLTNKPLVIFITAYDQYAVESFSMDVVDYLVKPVSMERFSLACHKAYKIFLAEKTEHASVVGSQKASKEDFFFVNVEYSLVKIPIPQVTHIEGLKDYIKIYLEGEKRPILTKMTMKSIEARVVDFMFMRVHKSFIVNLRKINSIKHQRIKIGEIEIPVSDSHAAELLEKIGSL
ncbi:LytR/AlgR family response regulator transcription factor [Sandaracinomonas limnophila]|nr:LytTR family DNA-binding domain-containing protein [Sandaracinomonas limnophila]